MYVSTCTAGSAAWLLSTLAVSTYHACKHVLVCGPHDANVNGVCTTMSDWILYHALLCSNVCEVLPRLLDRFVYTMLPSFGWVPVKHSSSRWDRWRCILLCGKVCLTAEGLKCWWVVKLGVVGDVLRVGFLQGGTSLPPSTPNANPPDLM